eukprot:TRINITY_DN2087_c0_g1_i3.p1 TRINITY_DN2087_c0_g1~~TRINITY_DN2087_c0_g1_i3.p1  ORF type:complete len:444 (+),score=105.07 TRINITY_DN2087_c0_g1_i3:1542-2873(+)
MISSSLHQIKEKLVNATGYDWKKIFGDKIFDLSRTQCAESHLYSHLYDWNFVLRGPAQTFSLGRKKMESCWNESILISDESSVSFFLIPKESDGSPTNSNREKTKLELQVIFEGEGPKSCLMELLFRLSGFSFPTSYDSALAKDVFVLSQQLVSFLSQTKLLPKGRDSSHKRPIKRMTSSDSEENRYGLDKNISPTGSSGSMQSLSPNLTKSPKKTETQSREGSNGGSGGGTGGGGGGSSGGINNIDRGDCSTLTVRSLSCPAPRDDVRPRHRVSLSANILTPSNASTGGVSISLRSLRGRSNNPSRIHSVHENTVSFVSVGGVSSKSSIVDDTGEVIFRTPLSLNLKEIVPLRDNTPAMRRSKERSRSLPPSSRHCKKKSGKMVVFSPPKPYNQTSGEIDSDSLSISVDLIAPDGNFVISVESHKYGICHSDEGIFETPDLL